MLHCMAPVLVLGFTAATAYESTIEDAARDYRIQTYDTFRLNRDEYNRRRKIGDAVIGRFETANKQQQLAIMEWFAQSTSATRNGTSLPPLPQEFRSIEQLAEDAAGPESTREKEVPYESVSQGEQPLPGQLAASDATRDDESGEGEYGEGAFGDGESGEGESHATSIVKTDKVGFHPRSRTFSILGSVGRAVTNAIAAENETTFEQGTGTDVVDHQRSDESNLEAIVPPEADSINDPIPAESDDKSSDFLDEDMELEELIRDNPASEEPLEPTRETFQREVHWNQGEPFGDKVTNV